MYKGTTFVQKISESLLAGGSVFGTSEVLSAPTLTELPTNDPTADTVIAVVVGVIVPFLKDLLYRWAEKRRAKKAAKLAK